MRHTTGFQTAIQLLVLTLLGISAVEGQQYVISTVAGGAPPPTPIAGVQASIGSPHGVAVDLAGNLYFTSLNCVFRLDSNGVVTRVAGTSRPGYSGDDGPATDASLAEPFGVAVDANGNLYVGDGDRIRRISATGIITTVAGGGSGGLGDGGPAISAQLSGPQGVAVDSSGNLYIADYFNHRIRRVSTTGIMSTLAGNGARGYSGDGGPAAIAQLNGPSGVAVDGSGNLYIADYFNNRIRKVSATGIITTVAGNGAGGYGGDGGPAANAQLSWPTAVTVDSSGNLYIGVSSDNRIRTVSTAGIITTVAGNGYPGYSGDGGPAINAQLSGPRGVVVDSSGNLCIADYGNNRIRKVSTIGIITTVAGGGSGGLGDGGPAISAYLGSPSSVAVDSSGNLYIAELFNHRIRKVSPTGIITTVAGDGSLGYSGDGGPAISAQLSGPRGVAVDSSGNVYIADSNNNRIRKVSLTGLITTLAGNGSYGYSGDGGPAAAAQFRSPTAVAVDDGGNVYIADSGNNRIRKASPAGLITTVAGNGSYGYSGDGGPAADAQFSSPAAVTVDDDGNLYIADSANNRIRKVSAGGIITTVAGNGTQGYSGDSGPAADAQLNFPQGIAVDGSRNLYIADWGNRLIRRVSEGIITTIAGNGSPGYWGDGGPATNAPLTGPEGVAVDSSGNVFIADLDNNVVRLLTPSGSACAYAVSPTSLQPPVAGDSPVLTITTGAGCAWVISNLPDWISVSGSAASSGSATVILVIAANSGAPRSAPILVAGIAVSVNQASSVLLVAAGGVVNAASYTTPVVPGSIASIFGNFLLPAPVSLSSFPVPTNLGGLSFQFSGAPLAPLFYANLGQANGQVPWELAGQSQTTLTASFNGRTSAPQSVSLATYAPGIFAQNGAGTGQGSILDTNYRLVDATNPAIAGSTVLQIYCTGLGPVTNQPATGAPSPGNPLAQTTTLPTVTTGGATTNALFSGLAPGFVGLYQVNAQVPQAATKGSAVPVVISIGGAQSNTVTIAVQ